MDNLHAAGQRPVSTTTLRARLVAAARRHLSRPLPPCLIGRHPGAHPAERVLWRAGPPPRC